MSSKMVDISGVWQCNKYGPTKVTRIDDKTFNAAGNKITRNGDGFQVCYPSGVWNGVMEDTRLKWCRQRDGCISYWYRVVECGWREKAKLFKKGIELEKLRDMEHTGCAYVSWRRRRRR